MDEIVMVNGQSGRLWLCKREDGHALGLRVKVQRGGLPIERLLLFREAVLPECAEGAEEIGSVDGTMLGIVCSVCGSKRTWWMSDNGKRLLAKTYLAE